jgi:hypothetical protein
MPTPVLTFTFPGQINEHAARVVATVVTTTLVVAFAFGWWWAVPVLASGFLLRVAWGPRFSVLARFAMAVAKKFWRPRPVTGAPKRFAQGIGATCTVTSTILFATGHTSYAWGVAMLVAFFAFLEAAFAFCMACWLFGRLQALGVIPPDVCTACAPGQHGDGI